jgi:ureidoglycolate lyase
MADMTPGARDDREVLTVPRLEATRSNTAEYGLFIGTDVHRQGLTIPFYRGSVEEGYNLPFECDGSAVIRTARISPRAPCVLWLERHMKMTQLFIGLGDQPFAMVLGQPTHDTQAPLIPNLNKVVCFVFPPGHGIMIHKGTWHDFPISLGEPVTCLTANSPAVVEALAGMKAAQEMDHGDVYKINVLERTRTHVRVPDLA